VPATQPSMSSWAATACGLRKVQFRMTYPGAHAS
jgi:hypothetical protein